MNPFCHPVPKFGETREVIEDHMMTRILSNATSRFLIGACLSVGIASAAAAQDNDDPMEGTDEGRSPDGVTSERVEELIDGGIIDRQARIGEDMLVIGREVERIQAIRDLLSLLGVEGLRAHYPDLAESLEGSPLVLSSRITEAELEAELEEALSRDEDADDLLDVTSSVAPVGGDTLMDAPVRTDGESTEPAENEIDNLRQDLEQMMQASRQEITRNIMAELDGRLPEQEEQRRERPREISLREIYGARGEYRAIIRFGDRRVQVREGDELPGDITIEEIGSDYLETMSRGEIERFDLSG